MPAITDSVQFVKGIGPKKVKLFEKLHISTLQDALETYPRDYVTARTSRASRTSQMRTDMPCAQFSAPSRRSAASARA